ncbi:hypothetical protein [Pseudokineococcus lusitanus]|uniref:Uncharacterized protein n=1 Tax=Pseudokineococcus lusitanus TaxID=763993 RepID=A0A3N1HQF9_9ACTN|nr:hypothetical protein [Pseudokineococcus lusitanus]ROP44676.1 hypothetical protein EDC03_0802 [Pseudokineococcus lusitanus]
MEAALAALFDWTKDIGCTHVRAEVPLERDRQVLTDAGLRGHGRGVAEGRFTSEVARALLLVGMPERIWVWRHGALVIYVHETWDSVVVTADVDAIENLRGRIAEAVTP